MSEGRYAPVEEFKHRVEQLLEQAEAPCYNGNRVAVVNGLKIVHFGGSEPKPRSLYGAIWPLWGMATGYREYGHLGGQIAVIYRQGDVDLVRRWSFLDPAGSLFNYTYSERVLTDPQDQAAVKEWLNAPSSKHEALGQLAVVNSAECTQI